MSSQTEEPLVPGHVGFNDAHTLLDAEEQSSSRSNSNSSHKSRSQSQYQPEISLPTQNKGAKVAEVNIGDERRRSVVREEEVGDDENEAGVGGRGGRGGSGAVGMVDGEGQKAMREGREVI